MRKPLIRNEPRNPRYPYHENESLKAREPYTQSEPGVEIAPS